jgi:dipeptidase E
MQLILASELTDILNKIMPTLQKMDVRSVLCIPTAANVYALDKRAWQTEEINALRGLGLEVEIFDLEGKSFDEVQAKLNAYQAVYVTGGNTYFLLEHMLNSGFTRALAGWTGQDKVFIGSSAGAVVACPRIDYIEKMDEPKKSTLTEFVGLNLYPYFMVPHADHTEYGPIAQKIVRDWQNKGHKMVALNDDQVLLWDGTHESIL